MLQEVPWGPESGRKALPEAEGRDMGILWILEDSDHCQQEDDPLCKSGMMQERHHQKGLHQVG
jgi:hypothetical protein